MTSRKRVCTNYKYEIKESYIDILDMKYAQSKGIVPTMIDDAAQAKVKTYPLRRGISVLEGSGGNIAVLTGKDGKLLIDSGFTVSKVRTL